MIFRAREGPTPDNIALAERLAKLPANVAQGKPPEQREVGSLMIWVSSFATYVAIMAQVHPDRVTDMLAYMRLIIRETSKFGGNGWLTYDNSISPQPGGLQPVVERHRPVPPRSLHRRPEGTGNIPLSHMPGGEPS